MRLLLTAVAILYTFGIHPALGDLNGALPGFAVPALYVISGYPVLRESPNREKRILRAIGRTAVCFGILLAVVGAVLAAGEYLALYFTGKPVYTSHLLGMGLVGVAVALFCLAFGGMKLRTGLFRRHNRYEMMIPYYVCSPLCYLTLKAIRTYFGDSADTASGYTGIAAALLSILALYVYFCLRRVFRIFRMIRAEKKKM